MKRKKPEVSAAVVKRKIAEKEEKQAHLKGFAWDEESRTL